MLRFALMLRGDAMYSTQAHAYYETSGILDFARDLQKFGLIQRGIAAELNRRGMKTRTETPFTSP